MIKGYTNKEIMDALTTIRSVCKKQKIVMIVLSIAIPMIVV